MPATYIGYENLSLAKDVLVAFRDAGPVSPGGPSKPGYSSAITEAVHGEEWNSGTAYALGTLEGLCWDRYKANPEHVLGIYGWPAIVRLTNSTIQQIDDEQQAKLLS